jgi:hypothetical protein
MIKGYKTVLFNGAVAALPILDALVANGKLLGALLGPYGAGIVGFLGIANIVLRAVTKTPVFKSK